MQIDEPPFAFSNFTIGELLAFRKLLQLMIDEPTCNIVEASQKVVAGSHSAKTLRNREAEFREKFEELNLKRYIERASGSGKHVTSNTKECAEAIVTTIDAAIRELGRLSHISDELPEPNAVKFASLLSVLDYIGPALFTTIQQTEPQSHARAPNVTMFYGELNRQLQMLKAREIDFCIGRSTKMALSSGLGKLELPFRSREFGLIFKLSAKLPSLRLLCNSLRSNEKNRKAAVQSALRQCPLITLNWLPDDGDEPFVSRLVRAIRELSIGRRSSNLIEVPTSKSCMQLVSTGLGVGFGHPPTLKPLNKVSTFGSIGGDKVIVGRDPSMPNVNLVYIPSSVIDVPKQLAKEMKFSVYFRQNSPEGVGIEFSDMPLASKRVLQELIAICEGRRGDFGYLEFEEGYLCHNFHFGGISSIKVPI